MKYYGGLNWLHHPIKVIFNKSSLIRVSRWSDKKHFDRHIYISFSFLKYLAKLVPKVLKIIPQNQPLCYFASFSFALKTQCINKPDSSKDLAIFLIASISSFEVTKCCSQSKKLILIVSYLLLVLPLLILME